MLRIQARQLELPADFVIYDDADCVELVKEVFDLSSDKDAQKLFFDLASDRQLSLDYSLEKPYTSLHLSEYGIVKHLAANSGNLAMIGDLDQTIYEWRGSEPDKVIKQFKLLV